MALQRLSDYNAHMDHPTMRLALLLATGQDWPFLSTDEDRKTYAAKDVQAAWERYGKALVALHVEHYPRSRPWAWWQLDAPEARKMVKQGPTKSKLLTAWLKRP